MKPHFQSDDQPLVLVVDDHEDARESYARVLAAHGYRAEGAADGLEALDKALALRPNLIVMDLSLPGLKDPLMRRVAEGMLEAQVEEQRPLAAARPHAQGERQPGNDL